MEVTQKALAACLGVSDRQILNLKNAGLFQLPAGQKKYRLESCIKEYIEFKVNDETGRRTIISKEKVSAEHEEVKKQIALLKLRRLRRELHVAADVESYLSGMLLRFKNRLLSMPAKVAVQVVGVNDANEIIGLITEFVNEALTELSEYDPNEIDGAEEGVYEEESEEEEEII